MRAFLSGDYQPCPQQRLTNGGRAVSVGGHAAEHVEQTQDSDKHADPAEGQLLGRLHRDQERQ